MHIPTWRRLTAAAVLALLATACGSSANTNATVHDTATTRPGTTTAARSTPGATESTPDTTIPDTTTTTTSTTSASDTTIPETAAGSPNTTAPNTTAPDTTAPDTTAPDTTAPNTTTSGPSTTTTSTSTTTTTLPDSTGHHGAAGEPTRFDADLTGAAQTITVEIVGGDPVGGHQRVEVALGSVVALMVSSDTVEEVHVHGYDILRAVSHGHPAHFAFTAEIPGVFEVELEGSGRLLLLLEIS